MKKKISLTIALCLILVSCDEPETVVTNIVRRDGSVLRKIEMKNSKNEFQAKSFQVPVDSTWKQTDSISISADGDTTWYLFAEKIFENTDAINSEYLADSGANKAVTRQVFFERKFKWFTTTYSFSEKIEKSLLYGYPIENFLTTNEIQFMNLPFFTVKKLMAGSDSTYYKSLSDSLDESTEELLIRSLISEWAEEAGKLCVSSGNDSLTTTSLKAHENELFNLPDTIDFNEAISIVMGDTNYEKYKSEFDSAIHIAENRFDKSISFKEYTMQFVIPEKIVSTNGTITEAGVIAWPVRGELFLSDDYVMYATSRNTNYWAIIITFLFLIFIAADLTGHIHKRKGFRK